MCLSGIVCMGKLEHCSRHRGQPWGGSLASDSLDMIIYNLKLDYFTGLQAMPSLSSCMTRYIGIVPLSLHRPFTAQMKCWCLGLGHKHELDLCCCADCRVWVSSLGLISLSDS